MKVTGGAEKKREVTPAGIHVMKLIGIIDLGTQKTEFKGTEKINPWVKFIFELPFQRRAFKESGPEEPMRVSKEYRKTLYGDSTLKKDIESWAMRQLTADELKNGYDLKKLLGRACQGNIVHQTSKKGDLYAKIASILPLQKEVKDQKGNIVQHAQVCPETETKLIYFDMDDPSTLNNFDSLSKTEKEKISKCPEYIKITTGAVMSETSSGVESTEEEF